MNIAPSKKILAVASGGGHWVQLMRLRPAFDGHQVEYVTTNDGYRSEIDDRLHVVTDASMWEKFRLIKMFLEVAWVALTCRPDIVITTGAAPGLAAVMCGRLIGARTVWIDSMANSEELSRSGKLARRFSNLWVTQWQHLARDEGPQFWGTVL